jgi:basic amino acid/polyamine antiporter, APA family
VQAVVLAAEEPSKIRGGALLGGRGALDNFVGEATKYVLAKAPCQVILTAPPASDPPASRDGAAPETPAGGDVAAPGGNGAAVSDAGDAR